MDYTTSAQRALAAFYANRSINDKERLRESKNRSENPMVFSLQHQGRTAWPGSFSGTFFEDPITAMAEDYLGE
jgi:hypothetical protein